MTHTRWRSDGHLTGLINKGSSLSSLTAHGLTGTPIQGIRACLAEEFSAVHVLHLRGNATNALANVHDVPKGEMCLVVVHAPQSLSPSSLRTRTLHTRVAESTTDDIGDYLTRQQKLARTDRSSIHKGYSAIGRQSRQINTTIGLTSAAKRLPSSIRLGIKGNKGRQERDDAIFRLYSS